MKPQTQPNWWSCLPTAFAIALDMDVRQLIEEIGHDGSEIVFPSVKEPYCRRAFHPQEFLEPCFNRGFVLMIVEAMPVIATPFSANEYHPVQFPGGNGVRLVKYTEKYAGIFAGEFDNKPHAVAWDRESYFNTDGTIHGDMNFGIREFFALVPAKSDQR